MFKCKHDLANRCCRPYYSNIQWKCHAHAVPGYYIRKVVFIVEVENRRAWCLEQVVVCNPDGLKLNNPPTVLVTPPWLTFTIFILTPISLQGPISISNSTAIKWTTLINNEKYLNRDYKTRGLWDVRGEINIRQRKKCVFAVAIFH